MLFNIFAPDASFAPASHFKSELVQLSEVLDGANHLRGVAVLVVVPGHDHRAR